MSESINPDSDEVAGGKCPCGSTITIGAKATSDDWDSFDRWNDAHAYCIPEDERVYVSSGRHRHFIPTAFVSRGTVWFTPDNDVQICLSPAMWRIAIRLIEQAISEADPDAGWGDVPVDGGPITQGSVSA